VVIRGDEFPEEDRYPFNLELLAGRREVAFGSPVTFLVGENGCGKSTLLSALARACGIHIWSPDRRARHAPNAHEESLWRYLELHWSDGRVPGAFFAAELFRGFSRLLDEWAASDPGVLRYYGGRSLMDQSHGQSHMAYFRHRFALRGIYLLDEPENALSPRRLVELLGILEQAGPEAQFIIASHSPILMSCRNAVLYSLDGPEIRPVRYEDTDHYRLYQGFFRNHADGRQAGPG
jgi:predicted ATPase